MDNHALSDVLQHYVGKAVVLDTSDTMVYLGTLVDVNSCGFWLESADVHDCREGHANKESYVHEAKTDGIRTNRRRIFVMREAVLSVSAVDEVVQEDLTA